MYHCLGMRHMVCNGCLQHLPKQMLCDANRIILVVCANGVCDSDQLTGRTHRCISLMYIVTPDTCTRRQRWALTHIGTFTAGALLADRACLPGLWLQCQVQGTTLWHKVGSICRPNDASTLKRTSGSSTATTSTCRSNAASEWSFVTCSAKNSNVEQ
jgi:hypothetical protein